MADADSRGHKVNKVHKKKTMCRKMHSIDEEGLLLSYYIENDTVQRTFMFD